MLGHVTSHMTPIYQIRLAGLKTHNLILGATYIVESIAPTDTELARTNVMSLVSQVG